MSDIKMDIVRMHKAGIPPETIADELGVPNASVLAVLLRAGVDEKALFGEGAREMGPEGRRGIVALYVGRQPVGTIARRYGVKPLVIYEILSEEGVPVQRYRAKEALARLRRDADVVQLYLDGMLVWKIVIQTGMSQDRLHKTLEKYNVPLRAPKSSWRVSRPRGTFVHPQTLLEEALKDSPE